MIPLHWRRMTGAVRQMRHRLGRFAGQVNDWRAAPARFSMPLVTAAVAGLALVVLAVELLADLRGPTAPAKTPSGGLVAEVPTLADLPATATFALDWGLVEPGAGPVAADPPPRQGIFRGEAGPGGAELEEGGIATPTSLPLVPEAPPELADVALELQQRREQLLQLEARLAIREAALRAAEADLAAQLDRLEGLRGELEELVGLANTEEEERQQQLVKVYESMRAKSAAQIFDRLDLAVLLPVAKRMKEVKMAAILAAMNPDRARVVTSELAREQSLPILD